MARRLLHGQRMFRSGGPLALCLVLASACTGPDDAAPGGGDQSDESAALPPSGKKLPKKRRSFTAVTCPPDDAKVPVAFFDADSTIRVSKSGSVSANAKDDVNVLPFAAEVIEALDDEFLVAVVSNQGGVADGFVTFKVAEGALAFAIAQLDRMGARVNYFDMAEKKDEFRKPETGMATMLDSLLIERCGAGIDFERSFMVGDSGFKKGVDGPHPDGRPADDFSNSDRLFAENLDIPFHEPTDFFHWKPFEVFNIENEDQLVKFIEAIEARAAELDEEGGDPAEVERLEREAKNLRIVNGL